MNLDFKETLILSSSSYEGELLDNELLIVDLSKFKYSNINITNFNYFNNFGGIVLVCHKYVAYLIVEQIEVEEIVKLIQILTSGMVVSIDGESTKYDENLVPYTRIKDMIVDNLHKRIKNNKYKQEIFKNNLDKVKDFSYFIKDIKVETEEVVSTLFAIFLEEKIIIKEKNEYYLGKEKIDFNYKAIHIYEIYETKDHLIISGEFIYLKEGTSIFKIKTDNGLYESAKIVDKEPSSLFGYNINNKKIFNFKIDVKGLNEIKIVCDDYKLVYHSNTIKLKKMNNKILTSNFIITQKDWKIRKNNLFNKYKEELKILLISKKYKMFMFRHLLYLNKIFTKKNVILVSDRLLQADDNGEYFLEYALKQKDKYDYYYVISNKSKDFNIVSQKFKVVDPSSFKYLFLLVRSKALISSQSSNWFKYSSYNGGKSKFVNSITNFKFVDLQHGMMFNDISHGHNRFKIQADLFFTSSKEEKELILNQPKYMYDEDQIIDLGMPRLDRLFNNQKENIILYMPTWRSKLVNQVNLKTNTYEYRETFKQSTYLQKTNEFLNSKKLEEILEKYNYKLYFVPHPNLSGQLKDYKVVKNVEIKNSSEIIYSDLISKSKMLITDFSSVAFDALYAKIKVSQYYFDDDNIEKFHAIIPDNRFQVEGKELCSMFDNPDDIVSDILHSIESEFEVEEKYKKNIEELFGNSNTNNTEKIYNKIMEYINE